MGVDRAPFPCLDTAWIGSTLWALIQPSPSRVCTCNDRAAAEPSLCNATTASHLCMLECILGKNRSLPTGKCEAKPETQGITRSKTQTEVRMSGLWSLVLFNLCGFGIQPLPKPLAL